MAGFIFFNLFFLLFCVFTWFVRFPTDCPYMMHYKLCVTMRNVWTEMRLTVLCVHVF